MPEPRSFKFRTPLDFKLFMAVKMFKDFMIGNLKTLRT